MAWHDNVRVDALWTINEHANAWAWIDGAWRKFDDNHEDSVMNMAILAAHAKGECYGRLNCLSKPSREPLAWILEILPPA